MDFNLCGPPTISRDGFRLLLDEHQAPQAVREGADDLWTACRKHRVDPNVALGFAKKEHSLTWEGIAGKTRSWGNLRPGSSWTGRVRDRERGEFPSLRDAERAHATDLFRVYNSYAHGMEDFARLLHKLYWEEWGLRTVSKAVPKYAPENDGNKVRQYIEFLNDQCCAVWEARFRNVGPKLDWQKATIKADAKIRLGGKLNDIEGSVLHEVETNTECDVLPGYIVGDGWRGVNRWRVVRIPGEVIGLTNQANLEVR